MFKIADGFAPVILSHNFLSRTITYFILKPHDMKRIIIFSFTLFYSFYASAQCNLAVTPDYSSATCEDDGAGGLLLNIPLVVTGGVGTVWIELGGNNTFDPGGDIEITGGLTLAFSTNIDLTIFDDGDASCVVNVTILADDYTCLGADQGDPILSAICDFTATADVASYVCNGNGTATVSINVSNASGSVTFDNPDVTTVADGTEYTITLPIGAGCGTTTLTASDNGSVMLTPIVEITAPSAIAGDITTVGTNASGTWGIDISTVSPCVSGSLIAPIDGLAPDSDFCEPTPPTAPTAAQCNGMAGNIAIIDRGACNFTTKAENAQACGAVAVIICNNDAANPDDVLTMGGTSLNPITIPAVMLSYNDCQAIYAQIASGEDVTACIGAQMSLPCQTSIQIDTCPFDCDTPPVCEDNIAGTINLPGCDFTSTMVVVYDSSGAQVGMTATDMAGNYALTGPFPCGTYTVELSNLPTCYIDANGDTGPGQFVINGDGIPDGVDFIPPPENVPTIGEWGFILLALLMSISAIVGIRQRKTVLESL